MRFRMPGLSWADHTFQVPLDHDDPGSPLIEVFARELVAGPEPRPELPMLLFLQGGPGMRADRPTSTSAWLSTALRGYRVLLLDQRGTGRSTPATRHSLARLPDPEAQAAYLRHFRADATVRDAELIRRELLGDQPWSVLGQSYGGVLAEFEQLEPGTNLFGELVFPWLFDEDPVLRPLKACAEVLAARDDWPRLYDVDQLARNTVPVAAAVYFDDLYVDREHSLRTAGAIRGLRPWITNEFVHNGLGEDGRVFERLHAMVRDEV